MHVATILPTPYLPMIADRPYHMALAHLIGVDKAYTAFYAKMVNEGKFVIMDNGVIETGVAMSIVRVVQKAKLIGAHELILPDTLDHSEATLDAACEAIPYVRKYFDGKIMGVPQGRTFEEWIECAKLMLEMDVDTIGIPKRLVKIAGRDGRLMALETLAWSLRGRDVHLLGCWETPIECTMIEKAVQAKRIVPVRGVDSAIAYVYARENMFISQGPRPSGAVDFEAKDVKDLRVLMRNIELWEAACDLSKPGVYQLC